MEKLTALEYRQTRRDIRDTSSRALDALDALHAHLTRGDADGARHWARVLAYTADDLTALLERVVRHVRHERQP